MDIEFIAVVWDPSLESAAHAAAGIQRALPDRCPSMQLVVALKGLAFYVSTRDKANLPLTLLRENRGLIFGRLFNRERSGDGEPASRATMTVHASSHSISSGGRHLINSYWGHYLAFLIDEQRGAKWVLRSPACHQPCLYVDHDGVRLYFSETEQIVHLGLSEFTVNWDFVAACVGAGRLNTRETGIAEIQELLTGECQCLSRSKSTTHFYWRPTDIAKERSITDLREARRELESTVTYCVSTWAAQFPNIVQRLSGGVDSSIVTACLRKAKSKPRVTCLNYYAEGTYGDERRYARAVAEKLNFPLIEYRRASATPLEMLLRLPRTESPFSYMSRGAYDVREIELASELGATARFTGIMGDTLFQMPPASPGVTEYLKRRGINRQFLSLLIDSAQMDRVSIWKVLSAAVRDGILRPPTRAKPLEFSMERDSLLSDVAREAAFDAAPLRFVHPWLQDMLGVPFGKASQIASVCFNSTYFNTLHGPNESELVHPLASEPLIEVCLQIPTYVLLRDGWDRALAREAFAPQLPEIVTKRTTKGSAIQYLKELVEYNSKFIREMLVDGILARRGILDRDRILESLPGTAARTNLPLPLLWAAVCAEAWLRGWADKHRGSQCFGTAQKEWATRQTSRIAASL